MSKITIYESVGNSSELVTNYRELENHHPSRHLQEDGRVYARVDGENEEILGNYRGTAVPTPGGEYMVSKDMVLTAPGLDNGRVPIPSPAAGVIGQIDRSDGVITINDPRTGDTMFQIRHARIDPDLKPGDRVEYGQSLGQQHGYNNGNPNAFPDHVHFDVNTRYIAQADKWIRDMHSGALTTDHRPAQTENLRGERPSFVPISGTFPKPADPPLADGKLSPGERGIEVERLQRALNQAGARDADGRQLNPDQDYGSRTRQAVENYQRSHGMTVNGVADSQMLTALGVIAPTQGQPQPAPQQTTPQQPQQPQQTTQPQQSNPYGFGAENALGRVIGGGEGGYNSYNRGVAGDAGGAQIDFSQLTVGEVMRRQALSSGDSDRLFAVGKYQFTPDTLSETVNALGIDRNARFTPQLQEKMFADYLIDEKRPSVRAYITGASSGPQGLERAQHALALEFASVGDPRKGGRGAYDGDSGGNLASISPAQVATALNTMRDQYQHNLQAGQTPEQAYRALSGDPNHFPQTTQGNQAPQTQGGDLSDTLLIRGEHGDGVRRLQEALNNAGIRDAQGQPLPLTGNFGEKTETAVRQYQQQHRLEVDGKAGRDTLTALGIHPGQQQAQPQTPAQPPAQPPPPTSTTQPQADASKTFLEQQPANVRAFLDLVAWREVNPSLAADGSPAGYRSRNGVPGSTGTMPESAIANNGTLPGNELRYNVGRYQMNGEDVSDMRNRYDKKIDDFSPESQDRIAIAKLKDRGAFTALQNGDIRTAIHEAGKEWASLPGARAGDGKQVPKGYTVDEAVEYYNKRLAFHQAQDRGQTAPTQGESRPTQSQNTNAMADGVLKLGEKGEDVRKLQQALNKNGATLEADGTFGPATKAAVEHFQRSHNLEADGVAGAKTLAALGMQPQAPVSSQPAQSVQPAQPDKPAAPPAPPTTNDKLQPPTQSDKPLISNPSHLDHRLYQQAVSNLEQLGPSGGFASREALEKAAAAVVADAKASGLNRIDHISRTQAPNGQTFLVTVQGDPTNPASKNSYIDYGQAVNQTVEQSSRMAEANKPPAPVVQPSEQAPLQEPNRVTMGSR